MMHAAIPRLHNIRPALMGLLAGTRPGVARRAGRVCVPIDPARCDDFDPTKVPTVTDLLHELEEYDRRQPGGSAANAGGGDEEDDFVDASGTRRIAGTNRADAGRTGWGSDCWQSPSSHGAASTAAGRPAGM